MRKFIDLRYKLYTTSNCIYIELTLINLFQLVVQFQECSTHASPNAMFMSLYKEIAKQTDSPTCHYAPQHNKYSNQAGIHDHTITNAFRQSQATPHASVRLRLINVQEYSRNVIQ